MRAALATIDTAASDAEPIGPEFAFERSDFELVRRLRETGHRSFRDYLGWLEGGASAAEWQEFVNCLRGTGPNAGRMRIKPEVASRVEFRRLNLVEPAWNLGATFHVVFCRNVMIHFDAATQRRVLEGMHRVMRPGGRLYVGHSENFTDARDLFRLRGRTVYERV